MTVPFLKLLFFEWTSGYGLYYTRPLIILVVLAGVFAVVYLIPVSAIPEFTSKESGIIRVWPVESVEVTDQGPKLTSASHLDRLHKEGVSVLWHALYFSILSAFHFGWRDLNVGSWITRIQRQQYVLRATGWVRTVSGIQSLISIYLVALWVLTTFGRPFE